MKRKNPFIYNAPVAPERFIGREREVDQILSQLANRARVSTAISGDPRVGKTSLLHYLGEDRLRTEWGLSSDWCHLIYLDCHSIAPFSEETFWRYILRELAKHLGDNETLNGRVQWLLLLEEVSPDIYDLNSLFDEVARAERLVVLILDEFESVIEHVDPQAPTLLYHLRALLNRPERGLALITATRPPLKQLCAGFRFTGSPFDNSFSTITLTPFNEFEVDDLLDQYGVTLTESERDYLRRVAGTHPYLVQLTASLILRAHRPQANGKSALEQIEADLERETERYFSDLLDYSSEREKMLLTWLALYQWEQQLPAHQAGLGDPVRIFGRFDQEIDRLIKRGLVIDHIEGPVLFSAPFGRSILRELVDSGGLETFSLWEKHYATFLNRAQLEAFKDLVDKITGASIIISRPELIDHLSDDIVNGGGSQVLGRYIIEELMSRSGLTDLFKGRDPRLGRPVAIKKLRSSLPKDEPARARFEREARAIATLRHPNIVQIYDFDIQSDHPYMVMEFVEGRSLKDYLDELHTSGQMVSWEEMLRIIGHVADALDYAHPRQMIHREIKPGNIMLAKNGDVFLADFSLVRLLGQSGITQTGQLIGSVAYMAPEQVRGESKEIDYRVDIYSLGCVVYEMLTGHPPFARSELPWAHLNTIPVSPDRLVPDLPEVASQVILKALAKNQDERPLSAAQFVKDLRRALTVRHNVRLGGSVVLPETPAAVVKQLYAESSHPRITEVSIQNEFHGGLSQARVILAQPIDDHGRGLAYEVVRIGPSAMLRQESDRYRQFVWGRLPTTAVSLERGPVELSNLACLSYGFVGDHPKGAVQDLEAYYEHHTADEVGGALTRLMQPLDARWYGQSEPLLTSFGDEYGQHLPAHLILRAERILPGGDFTPGSHRLIDVRAALHAGDQLKIGEQVALRDLQIVEVNPDRLKLRNVGDGPVVWVQAHLTTPRPDLQEEDWVNVLGVVEARRHDVLAAAAAGALDVTSALRRLSEQTVYMEGLDPPCPDPLAIYQDLLRRPLNGRESIIHGDLHPGNILVDESGRAWLIDFDHVREGHVLFDFIKLEIILRLFALGRVRYFLDQDRVFPSLSAGWPHTFTLAEYAAFEHGLLQQTLGQPARTAANPDLSKAAQVILAIRQLAQPYLRTPNAWGEYLTGLFLHSLAQLKFYRDQPQLGILPYATSVVVGQELRRLDDRNRYGPH